MNFHMKNQSKINKIILSLTLIVIACVIFKLDFDASVTKGFDRDFFSHGTSEHFERGEVFHEENVAWTLIRGSKQNCENWIQANDWEEWVQWRSPPESQKSHKDKWFRKIFDQYNVNVADIERVHSKIIDGSDAAYLIVISESANEDCICIICVFRS